MDQAARSFLNGLYKGNSYSYFHIIATYVHLGKNDDDDDDDRGSDNNSGGGCSDGGEYDDKKDG